MARRFDAFLVFVSACGARTPLEDFHWLDASNPKDAATIFDVTPIDVRPPGTDGGRSYRSCAEIHLAIPSATTAIYTINPEGTPISAFCEMDLGGGGFTAFFSGKAGSASVFGHFETTTSDCPDPALRCLRRLPSDVDASRPILARCGPHAIIFHFNANGIALFQKGQQSKWQPLSGSATPVAGSPVIAYATKVWTGEDGNQSWIISNDDNSPSFTSHTFMSSYDWNSGWDYCNGQPSAQEIVRLHYH